MEADGTPSRTGDDSAIADSSFNDLEELLKQRQKEVMEHREAILTLRKRRLLIKERQGAADDELLTFAREQWELDRHAALEDVAIRRFDLRAIQEQREALEEAQSRSLIGLEEIENEQKRREEARQARIAQALEMAKMGHVNNALKWGDLKAEEKTKLTQRVIEEEKEDTVSLLQRLAKEMEDLRTNEKEKGRLQRQQQIDKLHADIVEVETRLKELEGCRASMGGEETARSRQPDPYEQELENILDLVGWKQFKGMSSLLGQKKAEDSLSLEEKDEAETSSDTEIGKKRSKLDVKGYEGKDGGPGLKDLDDSVDKELARLEKHLRSKSMDTQKFVGQMETMLAMDEEVIADLNEEVWDLELEEEWLKGKWEEGGNLDWAQVQQRLKELQLHTADRACEDTNLSERETQLKSLEQMLKIQNEGCAQEKAILAVAAKLQHEVVDEVIHSIYAGHRYTLRKAAHIMSRPLIASAVVGQPYYREQQRSRVVDNYDNEGDDVVGGGTVPKGLEALVKGTLRELQRERKCGDADWHEFYRPSFATTKLPPVEVPPMSEVNSKEDGRSSESESQSTSSATVVGPHLLSGRPSPTPREVLVEDAMSRASRLRAQPLPSSSSSLVGLQGKLSCLSDLLEEVHEQEREWWAQSIQLPIQPSITLALAKESGGTTAVAMSSSNTARVTFLSAGTSKGGLYLWMLRDKAIYHNAHASSVETKKRKGAIWGPKVQQHHKGDDLDLPVPVLLRMRNKADILKAEQVPIVQLNFSSDGVSQLLSLEASGVVRLWCLVTSQTTASDEPAVQTDAFRVRPLVQRYVLEPQHLLRPCWGYLHQQFPPEILAAAAGTSVGKTGEKSNIKGKAAPASTLPVSVPLGLDKPVLMDDKMMRSCKATILAFHPAMSLLGDQPSFMVGMASGTLVKINTDAPASVGGGRATTPAAAAAAANKRKSIFKTEVKNEVAGMDNLGSPAIVYGPTCASYEVANPIGQQQRQQQQEEGRGVVGSSRKAAAALVAGTSISAEAMEAPGPSPVHREFLEFHRHPIIYLGFAPHALSLTVLTLDREGYVGLWPYREDCFTGFKWFVPLKSAHLDLAWHHYFHVSGDTQGRARTLYSADQSSSQLPSGSSPEAALNFLKSLPLKHWRSVRLSDGGREEMLIPARGGAAGGGGLEKVVDMYLVRYDATGRFVSQSVSAYEEIIWHGELLAAKPSTAKKEIVLLVRYKDQLIATSKETIGSNTTNKANAHRLSSSKRGPPSTHEAAAAAGNAGGLLKFFVLRADSLELLPLCIEYQLPRTSTSTPDFFITPVLEPTQTDYIYLVLGAACEAIIFSLNTGKRVDPHLVDIGVAKGGTTTTAAASSKNKERQKKVNMNTIMQCGGGSIAMDDGWRLEACLQHKWLVQYSPEASELRLRHLLRGSGVRRPSSSIEINSSSSSSLPASSRRRHHHGQDFRLWENGRALSVLLGRGRPSLDLTVCKHHGSHSPPIEVADVERMCRFLLRDIIEGVMEVRLQQMRLRRPSSYKDQEPVEKVRQKDGERGQEGEKGAEGETEGPLVPPFGRVPPISKGTESVPRWIRRHVSHSTVV